MAFALKKTGICLKKTKSDSGKMKPSFIFTKSDFIFMKQPSDIGIQGLGSAIGRKVLSLQT
ncbi:MAG: hypothetical protein LBL74_04225 [Bacteroidales bacterium]|jgi:hypothetical protein|nr:hypothetical protein [Bacteroidales bacterium]